MWSCKAAQKDDFNKPGNFAIASIAQKLKFELKQGVNLKLSALNGARFLVLSSL